MDAKGISSPTFAERMRSLARYGTLRVGLLGAILMWAALPPLHLAWLGWIAAVPWMWLARLPQLPGRRPYWALWIAGSTFWTLTNHWLRLPHPATSLGWLTLSFYLGVFAPLIVGLSRVAGRFGVSIVVAGPVMWIAAEQARAYIFTGFSMSSLCHSQFRNVDIIQMADLCGEFGVTFVMVLMAAAIARALPAGERKASWRWLLVPAVVAPAMFFYGRAVPQSEPQPTVALIQGSIESEVKHDPTKLPVVYEHYLELSRRAVAAAPNVELVVWPETMFPYPYWTWTDDLHPPPGEDWRPEQIVTTGRHFHDLIAQTAKTIGKPVLLGIAAAEFGAGQTKGFNAVLDVDAQGKPLGRYDKQHRVIFGEYIPMADWFPWLYAMTPLTGGIEAGSEAKSFLIGGRRYAPNVCYETTLARVILRQVSELRARGEDPDVLVNVTNDSWFRGSSELDLHLACGVFRAIEMRKQLLIAANTGISAQVDARGNILREGPRRAEAFLITADRAAPNGSSVFLAYGNWLAWVCLGLAFVTAAAGSLQRVGPTRRNVQ